SPYTTASVTTTAPADTSSEVSRKIKEKFKSRISNHVIRCLNPFRKPDCKCGQITNNEDFKHLARKLTHAILEKELKNVYSMEDLKVTDSVLRKARDYIRRYMVKIGPVYKRLVGTP
ncbi:unnamed protein product, partial [Soboliphyme baturini]|uniref:SRI domain-containing protein n=1 Tax=Soboliphyme baturini TaxID=241478 RepID=A0A183IV69_9BILA